MTTVVIGVWKDDVENLPGHRENQGAAYIYKKSGTKWVLEQKIQDNAGESRDLFGKSVSISSDGSTIAIGAHYHNSAKGAVYVYKKIYPGANPWGLVSKITASDSAANAALIAAVIISVT